MSNVPTTLCGISFYWGVPTFQKIGDGSINLAPSKKHLSFVSVCHYLLQFLEPLIRMVHHGIHKNSRQLTECVYTFQPPPLASLIRHLGHLTINPNCTLLHSNCRAHRTLLLTLLSLPIYQTPSSYTSIAGSIVFCLPGVKNIHWLCSTCSCLPNKHSST